MAWEITKASSYGEASRDGEKFAAAKAAGTLKSVKRTFSSDEYRKAFCDAMREAGWHLYLVPEMINLAEEVITSDQPSADAEEC